MVSLRVAIATLAVVAGLSATQSFAVEAIPDSELGELTGRVWFQASDCMPAPGGCPTGYRVGTAGTNCSGYNGHHCRFCNGEGSKACVTYTSIWHADDCATSPPTATCNDTVGYCSQGQCTTEAQPTFNLPDCGTRLECQN